MRMKYPLIYGIVLAAGLVLVHKSFAQTNSLLILTNETASPVQAAPSSLPAWEQRFFEIANDDGSQQEELLRDLAATVPADQIHDALAKLATDPSNPAKTLVVFLGQRWAEQSPADTAQWAAAHMSDDLFGHNLFGKIMVPWANKDLAGAVAWLQKMPAGGNKAAAALSLAMEAARLGQAVTAINLATNIPPGPERDSLFSYAAQHWAATDKDSAIAWIRKVPDPALREKMLGQVAINLGTQDPAAGTKLVATAMSAGKDQDNAMGTVIRFWAASTPADAAVWLQQFPDGPLHDLALENLMDTWGRKNLTEASQWLDKLPAGHTHDVAAKALAQSAK